MELMNLVGVEDYRLLLFQPDPETGERVCVGVAVGGELLYTKDFSRVQCFSHKPGPEILRLYLQSIRERITKLKGEELDRAIRDFAPMFVFSSPRTVVSPVTESTKMMLLRRFVSPGEQAGQSRMRFRKEFFGRLKEFAFRVPINPSNQVIENARPVDIFGEKPRGWGHIARVALAVKRENSILLMDGLDLNKKLGSQDLLRACAQVVHTFWQYGRMPKPYGEEVRRVAVIFNGSIKESAQTRDAHQFALDQFRKESDETIEASEPNSTERLVGLLA